MKKILILIIFIFTYSIVQAQSNNTLVNRNIAKAYAVIKSSIDFEGALYFFEEAVKLHNLKVGKEMAILGASIYFEIHHKRATLLEQLQFLEKAKYYASRYFDLARNRYSDEYANNKEISALILAHMEQLKRKIIKQKELRRVDSLKTKWKNKSLSLTIKVDRLYPFNKNGIAVFEHNGFFGVISDFGKVLIEAKEYKDYLSFDGYIILKNQKVNPSKIYAYNSKIKIGFQLPNIKDFNPSSTHFGCVMLPRGNGQIVTYPNNTNMPLIYDLNVKKFVKVANQIELLKKLKKLDIIDRYKKEGKVKINRVWYSFGQDLGGGMHPMYSAEGFILKGFLCSIDGDFLKTNSDYQFIGMFYKGKFEAIKRGKTFWINRNGIQVHKAKDEAETHLGKSKIRKLENGGYQIVRDGMIILGKEKLEKMPVFLKKFSKN
jgi:hypothetical protein